MTISKIYSKLRKGSKGQYMLLAFCTFLSVILISSFALMYFGPTVQDFLPEGGDTRKMASLLLLATACGCFVFTVYASGLFFRYKSREYGILMALGMQKKSLRSLLFKEPSLITAVSSVPGLICAVPASWLIWKVFELFIISNEQMTYRFSAAGFIPGLLFALCLAMMPGIAAGRFVKRSNIMDILRTQHKSEMVKEIRAGTFPAGLILIVIGILLGATAPRIAAKVFDVSLPGLLTNSFYILTLIGIYLVLLNIAAQSKAGKNKEKYYKNLVSISVMRFTAKQTTKSMCVIVLLLFVCCFSSFYGMQYFITPDSLGQDGGKAFSLHSPALENQIGEKEIHDTASDYDMTVTGYSENQAANLVISYHHKDFNEDGSKYIEVYSDGTKSALFVSAGDFAALSGKKISVNPGTYKTVVPVDFGGDFFDYEDGLDRITNPETKVTMPLSYVWEQKLADEKGKEYSYDYEIDMAMDNNMLLDDWKYAPGFNIITTQDKMQLISVYVMLCLYIFIISLAAISVMTFVRSISVATDNRALFDSLDKLGADRSYKRKILKKQLARIFQYPAVIGCGIGLLFSVAMDFFNDGRIHGTETTALSMLLIIICIVCVIMFAVYKYAMKKAERIAGI